EQHVVEVARRLRPLVERVETVDGALVQDRVVRPEVVGLEGQPRQYAQREEDEREARRHSPLVCPVPRYQKVGPVPRAIPRCDRRPLMLATAPPPVSVARVPSCALWGLEAALVTVEVDVANGLPAFQIVGLPDAAVSEARERVRAAIRNSGFEFPLRRVVANLAPAERKKEGTGFELAIALGVLRATG